MPLINAQDRVLCHHGIIIVHTFLSDALDPHHGSSGIGSWPSHTRVHSPQLAAAVAHSAAHVLGAALEEVFPGIMLTNGPGNTDGTFYYEGCWERCSAEVPHTIGATELATLEKVKSWLHVSQSPLYFHVNPRWLAHSHIQLIHVRFSLVATFNKRLCVD